MQDNQNEAAGPQELFMQTSQRYVLTIYDLFTFTDGVINGAEAEFAVLDGTAEIDYIKFCGKCQSKEGYSRIYEGKPSLTVRLLSGPEGISFTWGKTETDPYKPAITWRRGFANPKREPVELDVQDGRAEYLLSGPYNMTEGSSIQVVNGQVLYSGGAPTPK